MKKYLFIFCALLTISSNAQIWQNFKGVRLVNNSDSTAQLAIQGSIYYDDLNDAFWGRDNWGWKRFGTGSETLIDSTNFWRTKSNFTVYGNRMIDADPINGTALTFGFNTPFSEIHFFVAGAQGNAFLNVRGVFTPVAEFLTTSNTGEYSTWQTQPVTQNFFVSNGLNNESEISINFDSVRLESSNDTGINNAHITVKTDEIKLNAQSGGDIILMNLPTIDPCGSSPAGTLWNNSNVLNICP